MNVRIRHLRMSYHLHLFGFSRGPECILTDQTRVFDAFLLPYQARCVVFLSFRFAWMWFLAGPGCCWTWSFSEVPRLRVEKWGTLNDGVSRPRGPDGDRTEQQMVTDSSTVECFRCAVSISIIPRPPSRLHEHLRSDSSGLVPAAPLPWRDGGSPRCDWDTTATIYNTVHKSSLCECTFDKSLFIYM